MAEHDVATLAQAVNAFGYALHRELPEAGNCLFSPVSIASVLAALVPGARGETARELADVLETGQSEGMATTFGELLATLLSRSGSESAAGEGGDAPREGPGRALRVANALVAQSGYPILRAYRDTLEGYFRAVLFTVDFGDPDAAAGRVNHWVAKQTDGMIEVLLDPEAVSPDLRLAVLNAVYFRGTWSSPFEPSETSTRPFYLLPGSDPPTLAVPMMHQTDEFPHAVDEAVGFEAVRLPYEGRSSMLVIVPKPERFASVTASLDQAMLERILGALQPREIELGLPRFEVEQQHELTSALQALGVRRAFDREQADFTGIADETRELSVSQVTHRARVRVDEKGTEAAAATAGDLVFLGFDEGQTHTLIIDRPFLFVIRDDETGTVLFLGRVVDPRG